MWGKWELKKNIWKSEWENEEKRCWDDMHDRFKGLNEREREKFEWIRRSNESSDRMSVRRKLNEWVGGPKVVCKWEKEAEWTRGGIKEKKTRSVWILRKKRGWLIESSEKEEKEWMKK